MFKKLFFLFFITSIALSACGTLEVSLDRTPTPAVDEDLVATIVSATLVALPSTTSMPIPTLTPTKDITPTTDDSTTGWKSYKSEIYGFTFEYPADKFDVLGDNPIQLVNTFLPSQDGSQAAAVAGWLSYDISITRVEPNILVADWVSQNWSNQDNANQSNMNIDGIEAIKFQGQDFESKKNMYVFLIKDNNLIQISGHYLGSQNSRYYQQIKMTWMDMTDKFLTTFKFTK